ncbi:hypothetical protein B0H12DRAFT_1097071, partial [Mycena haematopus]
MKPESCPTGISQPRHNSTLATVSPNLTSRCHSNAPSPLLLPAGECKTLRSAQCKPRNPSRDAAFCRG